VHSQVLPPDRANSVERRRHVRHSLKSSTTVVIQLGPNNGGNLLDIGGGGISVQAVARLVPETEFALTFRLQGIEEPIRTVGRVTWVGPTQKVAGISFKNLPESPKHQIVEWIASQKPSAQNSPSSETNDSAQPQSMVSRHEITETEPDAAAPTLPQSSVSGYGISPQKKILLPVHKSFESITAHSNPVLDTITLSKSAAALSTRHSVSLDLSLISPAEANLSGSSTRELLRESFVSDSRRRHWKFAITVVAVVIGILALLKVMPQSGEWINRAKIFLGISAPAKMDPSKAGVQVWTHDGFYYCADDPNFQKVEPGAIMTQAEALQSAYKPRLGFCQ
jgi:hypothetical protein